VYAFLKTVVFTNAFSVMPTGWTVDFLAMGIVMSITLVIAIGIPLGQVKHGAYVIMGITFPFAFLAMEWFMFEYLVGVLDAGGSIVVHAAAWAFGFGMIHGIRHKGALTAPMDITTHSVSFVWLASMLLFILWPSFVTVLLTPGQIVDVAIVTYMSGFGAAVAAYAVNWVIDKKVDPLIYTYAMLCGMVAIGSTCDLVGPWAGLIIGVVAGGGSVLMFKYWQPVSERIFGVKDMMGVQNLHGFGGILGALICAVMFAGLVQVWALLGAIVIMIVVGVITGLLCRSRPEALVNDSEAFALEPDRQEPY
jgi:ammonium transporter Rh